MGRKHPQSEERSRRRNRLRDRNKPDYCYSEEQDENADMPDYNGPWEEGLPDFYRSDNPNDDGYLNDMQQLEENIEMYHCIVGAT